MKIKAAVLAISSLFAANGHAAIINLDVIDTSDDVISELTSSLIGTGINIIEGSEQFVGRIGDGLDVNTAQSATFDSASFSNGNQTISIDGGVLLTSGVANISDENTSSEFSHETLEILSPDTGSDQDLVTMLENANAPSSEVNDVNFFSFDFTVAEGLNAISLDFIFGSEEFPDQGVTDAFGVFVDGINYAFFGDGSLVSFADGLNENNFINNVDGGFDVEYDGFSNLLNLEGLLDLEREIHTLKIAISDTDDEIFDSGVFLSNLHGIQTDSEVGGIEDPIAVPAPAGMVLLLSGLALISTRRSRN